MAPIKKIIMVGAGGNVGTPILAALTARGFDITILSRKSSKSTFGSHKVITVSDDYPVDEVAAAFKGQDAVLSTITTSQGQGKLIDGAIKAGVRRFIPSEFGSDNRNEAAVELVPLFAEKRKTIELLQSKQDEIEWTAIPTGPFYDWGLKHQFLGFDVKNRKATIVEGGTNRFSVTSLFQVGDWVADVLAHADDTANQYVPVESFLVTQLEILAALEKTVGEKFSIDHQTGKELMDTAQTMLKNGNEFGGFILLRVSFLVPGYGSDFHNKASESMTKFGVKPLDLESETKRAVEAIGV